LEVHKIDGCRKVSYWLLISFTAEEFEEGCLEPLRESIGDGFKEGLRLLLFGLLLVFVAAAAGCCCCYYYDFGANEDLLSSFFLSLLSCPPFFMN